MKQEKQIDVTTKLNAEDINKYSCNITQTKKKQPQHKPTSDASSSSNKNIKHTISDATPAEIKEVIANLKNKTSHNIYGFTVKILRSIGSIISYPLSCFLGRPIVSTLTDVKSICRNNKRKISVIY